MENAKEWAIVHMEQLGNLVVHPALRLRLGRQYNITAWIRPALDSLVRQSLASLKPIHTEWLGYNSYQIIARTREALEGEYKLLACTPMDNTKLRGPDCTTHQMCVNTWRADWRKHIGQRILHPQWSYRLDLEDVEEALKALEFAGMDSECRLAAVKGVVESGALSIEGLIIGKAVQMLAQLPLDMSDIALPV